MGSSILGDAALHSESTKLQSENSATSHPALPSQNNANESLQDQIKKSFISDTKAGSHKSVLQSDALYQYLLETSVYPRENPYQRELREITEQHPWKAMGTSPAEGQFLMLLMKLINAKNTMELGVYTAYSLLSTALALPDDGKIIAMDMDREMGAPVIEKAGLSHKVDFREGLILPELDEMLLQEENMGFFDFIFVDADKDNYVNYHERVIKLVKVGGVIGYDNTLWNGSLVDPEDASYPFYVRYYVRLCLNLTDYLLRTSALKSASCP